MPDFILSMDLKRAMAINLRRERHAKNFTPYCGENPAPGKDVDGELDPTPGIREQPGSNSVIPVVSAARPLFLSSSVIWLCRKSPRKMRFP
jgi:hypothetical protein